MSDKLDKIEELFELAGIDSMFDDFNSIAMGETQFDKFVDCYISTTVKMRVVAEVKDLFSKVLTDEEVDGLLEFYKSNAGQAMVKKFPVLQREAMEIGNKIATEMTTDSVMEEEFEKWKIAMGISKEEKPKKKRVLN